MAATTTKQKRILPRAKRQSFAAALAATNKQYSTTLAKLTK